MSDLNRLYEEVLLKSPDTLGPGDIDTIIAYQRAARVRFESGKKPEKSPAPALDLSAIIPPKPPLLRR